uniref:Lipocalin/cytosolic fatty-acid binding domain-containing protein n=1 Tax=Scophthalmus maximus TaxID=52904 RepID=A0A8D3B8X6_SCOMX
MMNSLLRMLATLMCVLAACTNAMPIKDFSLEKMAGKWYSAGIATNAQWFVNNKAGMTMGTAVFVPTEGGDLDLSYANLNADGTCWRMTHNANKTDTPGRFTFHSQGEQSAHTQAHTSTHKHTQAHTSTHTEINTFFQQPDSLYSCFNQLGTMTTTCALSMSCTTTSLWSTPSRQRMECPRTSFLFTVSLDHYSKPSCILGNLCVLNPGFGEG